MMKLTNKAFVFMFLAVIAFSTVAILFARTMAGEHMAATVTKDGVILAVVDLDSVTEPYTLDAGEGNTVLIERGAISMMRADCKDQLCVKQGRVRSGAYPVVCLPNRVILTIEKGDDEIDAVVGRG